MLAGKSNPNLPFFYYDYLPKKNLVCEGTFVWDWRACAMSKNQACASTPSHHHQITFDLTRDTSSPRVPVQIFFFFICGVLNVTFDWCAHCAIILCVLSTLQGEKPEELRPKEMGTSVGLIQTECRTCSCNPKIVYGKCTVTVATY